MNGSRGKRIALFAALGVMLIGVGVLVWPEPKEARADEWPVTLILHWNGQQARDVQATAQAYNGALPAGDPVELDHDPNYAEWTGTVTDWGGDVIHIVFDWDYDNSQTGPDFEMKWGDAQGGGNHNPPQVVAAGSNIVGEFQYVVDQ